MTFRAACLILAWIPGLVCQAAQHPGLAPIEATQDRERRSRLALEFAQSRIDAATQAYRMDDLDKGAGELDALGDAVELAVKSLESTGRNPRRNPGPFKRAEIRTRKLLQQLHHARREAHPEDREAFDDAIERVETANHQLLLGIMSPKK